MKHKFLVLFMVIAALVTGGCAPASPEAGLQESKPESGDPQVVDLYKPEPIPKFDPEPAEAESETAPLQADIPAASDLNAGQLDGSPANQAFTLFAPSYAALMDTAYYDPAGMTYTAIHAPDNVLDALWKAAGPLAEQAPSTLSADAEIKYTLLLTWLDYSKITCNLFEGGLGINGDYYALPRESLVPLERAIGAAVSQGGNVSYAQWLYWMNPGRVVKASVDVGDCAYTLDDGEKILTLSTFLHNLAVTPASPVTYTGGYTVDPKTDTRITLTFDNGVQYRIAVSGKNQLCVESSDKSFGCRYAIQNAGDVIRRVQDIADEPPADNPLTAKPVIYLYPQAITDIDVRLDFDGQLSYAYPAYNGGWRVKAHPDGTLVNLADNSTHYYLFWEGYANKTDWDLSRGFVVKGGEAEAFLREKLAQMGLTPREYNDFIVYWAPELKKNAYNLVAFAGEEYEAVAPLTISPAPDSTLRVHMVYKAIDGPVSVQPQQIPPFVRTGFTVVEWGGTCLE